MGFLFWVGRLVMFEFLKEWTIYQIVTLVLLVFGSSIAIVTGLKALYNWFKRRKEKKEYDEIMKDPLEVHFFIPRKEVFEISYARQDSTVQEKDELEIPQGIEDAVFLRIKPRISVEVNQIYFGFLISEKRKKPEVFDYNPLKTSVPKQVYKDSYGHLHLIEERVFTPKEIYLRSFKIRTHEVGDYTFYLVFKVSCNEYKSIKEERHAKVENRTLKIRVKQKQDS